ncbi:FtsX-like permease family protein [Fulvivirga sp. M361]|uniref:ABC transporter permease n=1 Tax=Fulvivirga sp. M361 TaxID=2594266 RepID=UPI00117B3733|nr:ABC transporter permease [Fulvivirga sp. M361]TRX57584.1 FtsX-like permease family protein [Fulvivirga sp. M361]
MIKNYIKIALRYLLKNKVFSLINVIGMALGLACVLIILSYVHLELSYDNFHEHKESIFRVAVNWEDDGQRVNSAKNNAPLAPVLKESLSGIVNTVRMYPYPIVASADKENKIKESGFTFADSSFFRVFSFKAIRGNLATALDAPFSVVLSEGAALRHFGSTDVVGSTFYYEDERRKANFTVTAVMEDLPQNTHFQFDILGSFSTLETIMPRYDNWHYPPMYIYIQSQDELQYHQLNHQVNELTYSHLPDYVQAENREFILQPVTAIHLHSDMDHEWKSNSNVLYVKLFIIIAVFILIIACLNFVNLATARSSQRVREVGMRKALGAHRMQLVVQFLGESTITTFLAFVLSFGLAELVIRYFFKGFTHQQLSLDFMLNAEGVVYIIAAFLLISLFSGLYPAFYLSGQKPARALKGMQKSTSKRLNLRKGMVVFQFVVSSVLIAGTVIVIQQTQYLRGKDLGFDKESVVAIKMTDRMAQKNYQRLKQDILREASVANVALSSALMGSNDFYAFQTFPEGVKEQSEYTFKTLGVDEDFLTTYNIKLIAGRDFSRDIITDQKEAIILNQAAAKKLNWTEPLHKEFGLTVYTQKEEIRQSKVIGVVEDFHFASLYNQVEPLVIYINKHPYYSDFLSVKLHKGDLIENVQMLRSKWENFNPEKPFECYFIDQELDAFYHSELQKSRIFMAFSILSIFISCLGLFGIAAFSVQQRTKEVGIRKVLGASIMSIWNLISKEYVRIILLANVIALPIVWYVSDYWLQSFEYKVEINGAVFLFTLVVGLLLSLSTVSIHALKAAQTNPVKTLKSD